MGIQFALASDKVSVDAVEVTGYPDLAYKYNISGVPKTVVGETRDFVGARPEAFLLEQVKAAADGPPVSKSGLIV
ncbi:MAG: thioredoxin family protein [Vicinamibacteria bacterium]|nr:thioredoxin family protein [Vicinamibacteria bacterium]